MAQFTSADLTGITTCGLKLIKYWKSVFKGEERGRGFSHVLLIAII